MPACAVQRVGRDRGSQEIEQGNQLEGGRGLAAARRAALGKDQALLRGPGRDEMERGRLRSGLEGARKRLAVDRNDLPGKPHRAPQALRKGGREAAEDRLERLRVEQA